MNNEIYIYLCQMISSSGRTDRESLDMNLLRRPQAGFAKYGVGTVTLHFTHRHHMP